MKVPSTEVQNNFGRYMKIASEIEEVIVTKKGKETVKIIPCDSRSYFSEEPVKYSHYKLSFEDFIVMTEASDKRFEYIDGEAYMLASPSYKHQSVVFELTGRFYIWFQGKECKPLSSPFDITLTKENKSKNIVQPDIFVICDTEKIDKSGKYNGIPSLVVEVLSGSTKRKDMIKKLDLYMQSGIKEYWIADPDKKQIYMYIFENLDIADYLTFTEKETVRSKVFKGLEIRLSDIFTA